MLKRFISLVVCLFVIAGLSACSIDNKSNELLIVYGRATWPDGDCTLLVVNPAQSVITQHQGHPSCNYGVANIDGKDRLIAYTPYRASNPNESEIVVYDIDAAGDIFTEQTIQLNGIRITSMPQWGSNGWIYMSGIVEGHEQIYRYHVVTQELFPYIDIPDGFTASPQISPAYDKIAYEVIEGFNNHTECRTNCPKTELLLWDINSETSFSLTQLTTPFIANEAVRQYPVYCHKLWSPEGTYLAFEVGCGIQSERWSFVYKNQGQKQLEHLVAPDPYGYYSVRKWLTDNRLLLYAGETRDLQYPDRDMIYSVKEKTRKPLPVLLTEDSIPVFFDDWTSDGLHAIGQTTLSSEDENYDNVVVIMNLSGEQKESIYISIPDEDEYIRTPLIWSYTGKWAMYSSYRDESMNRFSVLDQEGKVVIETGLKQMFFPDYFWFELSATE